MDALSHFHRPYKHLFGGGGDPGDQETLSERYHKLREDYHIRGQILDVSHMILTAGNTSATLEDSFKQVIHICQDAIGCDTSVIELYDDEKKVLIGVATDDGPYKPQGYFKLPIEESSLSGLAFKAGHTVAIDDVKNDPRVSQRIRRQFDAQSGIAAPLLIENKVIGVILTMTRERKIHFTQRDISLMEGLANEAALAVHTQLLHKERVQAEHRFQRLVELAPSPILLLDTQFSIIEINKKTSEVFGYDETDMIGEMLQKFVSQQDSNHVNQAFSRLISKSEVNLETGFIHQQGHVVPVEISANYLSVAGQNVIQMFITDVTESHRAQAALRREKEKAQTTLRSICDAVVTADSNGCLDTLNPSAQKLICDEKSDVLGKAVNDVFVLLDEQSRKPINDPIKQCIESNSVVELTDGVLLLGKNGRETQVELNVSPLTTEDKGISGVVMVLHDVGPARKLAQEMSYMATHDTLTGLVNRGKFETQLERAIESAVTQGRHHVFCYIDLDRFKIVNDTCGHIAGDELLKQLSALFLQSVRESDTLARLGGDEFGLLIEGCDLENGLQIAESICAKVKEYHFNWAHKRFEVGASIGLIEVDANSGDLTQVLSNVDSACYEAKDRGRNRVQVYHPDDEQLVKRHGEMEWTQRIQNALADNRFELHCQEILDLKQVDERIRCEIFVKMLGENREEIPPNAFIPSAERYHLMPEVDKWVIRQSFAHIAVAPFDAHWFINLSGQSIGDEQVLNCIMEQLRQRDIDPNNICFEINETAAIANLSRAITFVKTLRRVGFRFALDDFGSGLSSFVYLKNLAVDYIKIHGEFVKNIDHDKEKRVMVEAITKVAHSIRLKTIAEFAENDAIVTQLKILDVDYAQGFGVSQPKKLQF